MTIDRPMTEREGALFDAVRVIGATVLELGADPQIMIGRLLEAQRQAEALGNTHGAATLGFLIRALFPKPDPAPKPSLRIV